MNAKVVLFIGCHKNEAFELNVGPELATIITSPLYGRPGLRTRGKLRMQGEDDAESQILETKKLKRAERDPLQATSSMSLSNNIRAAVHEFIDITFSLGYEYAPLVVRGCRKMSLASDDYGTGSSPLVARNELKVGVVNCILRDFCLNGSSGYEASKQAKHGSVGCSTTFQNEGVPHPAPPSLSTESSRSAHFRRSRWNVDPRLRFTTSWHQVNWMGSKRHPKRPSTLLLGPIPFVQRSGNNPDRSSWSRCLLD